ncbi:uncharacterized protein LOC120555230 isoform X2 [Perca fluviatilis]|uniref:uncharacterized protein LOC120555230 isoform X2 n=1 Tax=Perca fluviatilis TaxID=8168 RepID=UPI001965808C|nr:uncharacterized protein LOC120555230 isoform X2 [Perca fluviatilis]
MWARAVWREETMEMEEVIPSCWVKNGGVLWPTQGAARALKACKEPEESWTKFPLIKIKIQSDDKNECEKYDFTTTAELSGSEEELLTKRRPKKKKYPDYQMDEPSVNEDSQKESSPGLMIKSTGEKATKKIRKCIPCEDDFVLPPPPKMTNAQSGNYGTTTNTMKRRRILHPANTSNENQAKKRLTKDDFVLPPPPKMADTQFERTQMDIPSSPQSRSLAHSGRRSPSESLSNGRRSFSPDQESLSRSLSQRQRGGSSGSSTHGRRSFSPDQESLSRSLSQRQRGGSSGSSTHGRRSFSPDQESLSRSLSQRQRGGSSGSSTHGRSRSRRSLFKSLLQKRGWSSSESFSRRQNASEPTRSSKSDTPRTTIDRSLRQPPEKSMRAERDPPNAAKAMSTHARSNKLRKEDFPMSEKKFQKRVLQLLVEIKDTIHVATSSAGTSYEVKPANTEEELEALENRLENKNEGAELSKCLKRLGGVDAADHVKKSMAATMTNKMMAIMSLRGRSGKVAFMKTRLYKIICDAVLSSFDTTTTKVDEYMAKYLKYAPERMGGGGRKK